MKKNYKSIVLLVVMTVLSMFVSACGVKNDFGKNSKQPDFSVKISFFEDETKVTVDGVLDGIINEVTDGLMDLISW